jgi:predicted DNA-binding protein (MmcQ/YjbR family)
MNIEQFNAFCKALPATTTVVQWSGSRVWKVGGKVFSLANIDKHEKMGISFKTSEMNFHFLNEKPGYRPAPYLASRGMLWIQQYDAAALAEDLDEELIYYLTESYRLVANGLSKKKQKELGLLTD